MVDLLGGLGSVSNTVQGALNNFLGLSSTVDSNGVPRNAMVFSSTFRQLVGGRLPKSLLPATSQAILQETAEAQQTLSKGISTDIVMRVNPKSIQFKQPKRFIEKKVLNGSRFYHFTNSKGQNNDILRITFKGNTGNIDRRGSVSVSDNTGGALNDTGAFAKLITWQNLYLLTREPMLLPSGFENDFTISYISPLFPTLITFHGFFANVLDFEENADKPGSRDYSMEFVVTSSTPDLDDVLSDIQSVLAAAAILPDVNAQLLGTTSEGSGIAVPNNISLNNT